MGGVVEVIAHRAQNNHLIRSSFDLPQSIPVSEAQLPPFANSSWNGVLLATIQDDDDAEDVRALFDAWQPLIAINTLPSHLSRKKRSIYSSSENGLLNRIGYQRKDVKVRHEDVGGVTESAWHFVHFNRIEGGLPRGAIMMAPQFSRPLQTALDDTQGEIRGKTFVLEPPDQGVLLGTKTSIKLYASIKNEVRRAPVYDAGKLAPDVGTLPSKDRLIWVEANSVYLNDRKAVRPINIPELFSIWDYEGKYESRG